MIIIEDVCPPLFTKKKVMQLNQSITNMNLEFQRIVNIKIFLQG